MPRRIQQRDQRQNTNSMQPPLGSPSNGPLDPSLSIYPSSYYPYQQHPTQQQQQQQQRLTPHLPLPPNMSSPSSQGSETIGTPPDISHPNSNGKRPSSSLIVDSRKRIKNDDEDDGQSPMADKEDRKAKPTRGSRACMVCRRLKMKCVGAEQGPPCKRCQAGGHECIFEESNRGKRSSKKHELLTRSLRKMERTLDTVLRSIGNPDIASGYMSRSPSPSNQTATTQALLASPSPPPSATANSFPQQAGGSYPQNLHLNHQPPGSPKLHSLPDNSLNPLGLLAEASLANRRAHAGSFFDKDSTKIPSTESADYKKLGVASDLYFKPGPINILPLRRLYIERQIQPEMLGFVSTEEVIALFNIYFDHMNMHCNLLDRDFHTPSLVCSRSPFLLTTICSIASKFYTERPDLHSRLTELAKKLAFGVPAQGYKSVEIVQAYLLLTLYGCGAVERYEKDTTWLMLGMAIRMATDLNLHRKTATNSHDTPEGRARDKEVHNREKTWVLCFCLDRSASAQMGKPHSIKEDFIIRSASRWYKENVASPADASLAAYAELQRILSRSLDFLYSATSSPSGLQVDCDYMLVIKTIETQVLAWYQEWNNYKRLDATTYPKVIAQFYFNYSMLVLNSFGLQNAMERSAVDMGHFFARCHQSATACAKIARDELAPRGFLKYSPDSHFVMMSYAVLSLLKLIRPEFQPFLDNEQKTLALVKDVADTFESIAAHPHHTPALYSAFLRALISARIDGSTTNTNNDSASASTLPNEAKETGLNGNGYVQFGNLGMTMPNGHANDSLNEFQFDSEMGPVADISTFPPTMAAIPSQDDGLNGMMSMDSILSNNFWDSVLVPGYSNTVEGLSGGFVFGAGGSGIITPRWDATPIGSRPNSPSRGGQTSNEFTQFAPFHDTTKIVS